MNVLFIDLLIKLMVMPMIQTVITFQLWGILKYIYTSSLFVPKILIFPNNVKLAAMKDTHASMHRTINKNILFFFHIKIIF